MNESDDYKRGWYDGYNAAKQHNPLNPPLMPMDPNPIREPIINCPKCGVVWKGVMGYSCPLTDCPVQPKITY